MWIISSLVPEVSVATLPCMHTHILPCFLIMSCSPSPFRDRKQFCLCFCFVPLLQPRGILAVALCFSMIMEGGFTFLYFIPVSPDCYSVLSTSHSLSSHWQVRLIWYKNRHGERKTAVCVYEREGERERQQCVCERGRQQCVWEGERQQCVWERGRESSVSVRGRERAVCVREEEREQCVCVRKGVQWAVCLWTPGT